MAIVLVDCGRVIKDGSGVTYRTVPIPSNSLCGFSCFAYSLTGDGLYICRCCRRLSARIFQEPRSLHQADGVCQDQPQFVSVSACDERCCGECRVQASTIHSLVEVCNGNGKSGFPFFPWDSHGNGNGQKCNTGMGMGMGMSKREWEGMGMTKLWPNSHTAHLLGNVPRMIAFGNCNHVSTVTYFLWSWQVHVCLHE